MDIYIYEQGSGMIVLKKLKSGSHNMGFLLTIFYFRFWHVLCLCLFDCVMFCYCARVMCLLSVCVM